MISYDVEKMPIVDLANKIIITGVKARASDIHFDPSEDGLRVRMRIDGDLRDHAIIPKNSERNLITRIKLIAGMNITENRLPQDGAIKANIKNVDLDLRVSSIPTIEGEKIVIRILDYSMSNSGLEALGFSDINLKKVIQMISVPNGIILITGATGSGKSTTVYSILQRLNKEETNIITVEDPIEMNITGINQIQTNSEIGLDFATALRSILRQDPNIIMVGEIRDTETAKIAVRASITGHLVLSTIHTNDSLNTIERLLDMDVERYLLSSALTGIISQKLARKLCPHCRTKRPTTQYENDIFKKVLGHEVSEVYSSNGCEECGNGYSGRIAIHEVLMINQDIKDAISENIRKEALRELVYNSDVITLLQDGLEKVEAGLTTFEELLKIIELEEDEKLAGASSLERALEDTSITHNTDNENSSQDVDLTSEDTDISENNISEENVLNKSNDVSNEELPQMKPVYQKLDDIVDNNLIYSNIDNGSAEGINSVQAPVNEETNNSLNDVDSFSNQEMNNDSDNSNGQSDDNSIEENKPMGINDMLNNNMEKFDDLPKEEVNEQPKKNSFGINDLLNNLKKR